MSRRAAPQQIVIAFDGRTGGEDALALGSWMARNTGDVPLVVAVYIKDLVPVLPGIGADWTKEMRDNAHDALATARQILDGQPDAKFQAVGATSSAHGLDSVAEKVGAAMIVVGSSGRGVQRRVANNRTANRLFHGASVPVLIAPRGVRERPQPEPRHIGCAFVPSPEGRHAVRQAVHLARQTGAQLDLFTVVAGGFERVWVDPDTEGAYLDHMRSIYAAGLEKAVATVPNDVTVSTHLLDGDPVHALAALDDQDCQLLVCGSRGYGPVRRVLLGGVSDQLVRHAACPVIVVPRGAR